MEKPRPYITAALLCEKVLQEKDGSLSLVRIADNVQYHAVGLAQGTKPVFTIQGLLAFKSGPVSGDHKVNLIIEAPNGGRRDAFPHPIKVALRGNDHGQNLILNVSIEIAQDGLYWFDVMFDEELLTRIPLTITPLQEEAATEKMI